MGLPKKQGMYDPAFERDACGIGMLVDIKGVKSHRVVEDAVGILERLSHRGGAGGDAGDGAGILLQIPHAFFRRATASLNIKLPKEGGYGVATAFLSPERERGLKSLETLKEVIASEGMDVLGVRDVPVFRGALGEAARATCPDIRQIFIKRPDAASEAEFERKLYVASKVAHNKIRESSGGDGDAYFYLSGVSSKTLIYKGMLTPSQLTEFYPDLKDGDVISALALVHSRFSTNTFPSWERAHPMRNIIHNGEINTIRANAAKMRARESVLLHPAFPDIKKIMPVLSPEGSDSAMLDEFLSLLLNAGYTLPEAIMLAIPEPWENDTDMDAAKRAFYRYNSLLCEPWDGPAAIAFTDGVLAGATLDRNGLRPARYCVTKDGKLILSSEAGVLPDADITFKGRLMPGKMLLVDTAEGRIIGDAELKSAAANKRPYAEYLARLKTLDDIPLSASPVSFRDVVSELKSSALPRERAVSKLFQDEKFYGGAGAKPSLLTRQKLFGYTEEDINVTLKEIAEKGEDPVSSMGADTPLAVLSNRPQTLFNYFKQLFAQVTNPPIDALREKVVTSAAVHIGTEGNLLIPDETACSAAELPSPILSPAEIDKLKRACGEPLKSVTVPSLFPADGDLKGGLDVLFASAEAAIGRGYNVLILSDADADAERLPIPSLLAVSGLHQRLINAGLRTKASVIIETCEAREVHHAAALIGFGANAVCPVLAFETLNAMRDDGLLKDTREETERIYKDALTKSAVKIMSKMGISTMRSYHGAQVFEALGVGMSVIEKYFTGVPSRIGGVTLTEIETETRMRAAAAFSAAPDDADALDTGGDYKWRKSGEYHLFNPENIYYLQQSCRLGDYAMFKKYSECVNTRAKQLKNLRGLLDVECADKPLPLDEVESVEEIVKRFKTGAMSYGSLGAEAHECLAIAMNRLGGKSNTGEGGELPERFKIGKDGLNRCSAIKQVASGRFGVTIHYLNNAAEIQIKIAQGAKPGEGGHLPGKKVYPWIAAARYSTPGVELISPPPHHDVYSIEDLAQLIYDLKCANRAAKISVKLVSEAGVGTVAVGVAKGLADVIVISGYDGGTGAAPRTSIRHAGLPWELGVAEAHQALILNNLRGRVSIETDGKLLSGHDVVVAALLGAEEFAFATAPLIVLGCDMMRACNLDTCPAGIATQNPALRKDFSGKPEYVENFMRFIAREAREYMARMGVRRFSELVGHTELLRERNRAFNFKSGTVDLSALLHRARVVGNADGLPRAPKTHNLDKSMDARALLPVCRASLEGGKKTDARFSIRNTDRSVGCILSSEIARKKGAAGLPPDTVRVAFDGSAGQSFGAFLIRGVTFTLNGEGNDYLGKGMSGGKIIVAPPRDKIDDFEGNVIIGNVAFYGATSGEAYVRGAAGERFCVRNSGVCAVVEGVGDHGCEYMTGGRVAVLGETGRNFAAGMSGGEAYVYDANGDFYKRCNPDMVSLRDLDDANKKILKTMLERHLKYTGSLRAAAVLKNFGAEIKKFALVIPKDYERVVRLAAEGERPRKAEDKRKHG